MGLYSSRLLCLMLLYISYIIYDFISKIWPYQYTVCFYKYCFEFCDTQQLKRIYILYSVNWHILFFLIHSPVYDILGSLFSISSPYNLTYLGNLIPFLLGHHVLDIYVMKMKQMTTTPWLLEIIFYYTILFLYLLLFFPLIFYLTFSPFNHISIV